MKITADYLVQRLLSSLLCLLTRLSSNRSEVVFGHDHKPTIVGLIYLTRNQLRLKIHRLQKSEQI